MHSEIRLEDRCSSVCVVVHARWEKSPKEWM
jgi:hypothetical protein